MSENLDGDVAAAIGREILNGVTQEKSKFAPLTPAMKQAWRDYEEAFAKLPPGAVAEIPWSQSESPDPATWAPHDQQVRELIAKYRAHDAIRDSKPPE